MLKFLTTGQMIDQLQYGSVAISEKGYVEVTKDASGNIVSYPRGEIKTLNAPLLFLKWRIISVEERLQCKELIPRFNQ